MYDVTSIEEMGKPVAMLCNEGFATDARSAAATQGWPGIRVVPEAVPCECTQADKVDAAIRPVLDDIVAALTRPLTEEESCPKPREIGDQSRTTFKGTLQEVNHFFYRRGWSDGLPIVPPTEQAVAEMLKGTDLPPDHTLGKLMPRRGKITVEKIAINAVMAGALPTYMPVLIAGVQALLDPQSFFGTSQVSAASWAPFWIINGPVRRDLQVNCGSGALSPGNIANATIGRAMALIIKNIGGARPGIEDMGTYGNPGKYAMVCGENEEESPWEPLHVEHGFKGEDSAITLTFPMRFGFIHYFGWGSGSEAESILRRILANTAQGLTVLLNPQHARTLAEDGWTKKELEAYVHEHARVPAYRHRDYGHQPPGPGNRWPLDPEDTVPILRKSDVIRIVVTGGPGGNGFSVATGGGHAIKRIELPSNWPELVAKYKNLTPGYARY